MATAPLTGLSHLGVTDNQKRWLVAGIALNKILIPQIRPFVEQGVNTEYNNLKTSHNIHGQSTSGRLQRWPARKFLKYENINGNDVHPRLPGGRFNYSLFDCRVTSHVDFAKLYVENYMSKFSAFDDHCDTSAVLSLLNGIPVFSAAVQTAASDVRMARNDWAHCVFSKWDQAKFQQSFTEMENLVRVMALPAADERKLRDELKDWETKGTHLCMNSPVDPALLQLVQQELKSLQDFVNNMSVEIEEEKIAIQHELQNAATTLEEMKQIVQRLETGRQNLECRTEQVEKKLVDFQGNVNQRMEKLEISQQMTESHTALVEDRVNVDEDRVDHLQVFPKKLVDLIKRDYKGAVQCPFPWCEDELQLKLSKIFTRLKIVSKDKERARLTEDIVNMTDTFKSHDECEKPRVVLIEGQPGMGKTTYCLKLAYDWSVEDIALGASFPKVKLLLVLKCRDMKSANIEEVIDDQLLPLDVEKEEKEKFFNFIRRNQSKILLVLDGLDELSEDHLMALFPVIQGKRFSNTYLLMTARHEAGMKVRRHCDTLLEIVGYTRKDADSYITKYFSNHKDPSLANKLIAELKRDFRLREMTANPLNTALLCLLCEETEGVFPSNRTEMYTELVSCAIRRYFAKKSLPLYAKDPVETFSDNLNQLGKVALKALKADRMYFSKEEMKCQSIDVLRLCFLSREASVSKLRPMPCYAFTHKTFQEYFAAYHLAHEIRLGDKDSADTLLAQLSPVDKYWQVWEFLVTMVASGNGDAAALVISGFCANFRNHGISEQDSDSDEDEDDEGEDLHDVSDDRDFEICEDALNDFPSLPSFFAHFDKDENTRYQALYKVFNLISVCGDDKNELTDCQKKMVRALAMSFPIYRLDVYDSGDGMPSHTSILLEYLNSNTTLACLSYSLELNEPIIQAMELFLHCNCALKTLNLITFPPAFPFVDGKTRVLLTAVLAGALRSNCSLTHLNLQCRWIFSPEANKIPQALQSNDTLTHINLQGNDIDNSGAEDFATALRSTCALKYLDLSSNRIGDSGAFALAEALEYNRTLTYLDLGHLVSLDRSRPRFLHQMLLPQAGVDPEMYRIGDSGAAAFARALRSNSVLARLNLQHNRISDLGGAALGQSLESNCTLTHLSLRANRMAVAGVISLARTVYVNHGLVNLDLRGNFIGEAPGTLLASGLRPNTTLTHLDLRNSCIGCQVAKELAKRLQSNSTLKRLDLFDNTIKSPGAMALAKALQSNRTLSHLNLRFNHSGDIGAAEFVEALQTNKTLIFLDLRDNRISEAGAKKIERFLCVPDDAQIPESSRPTFLYNRRL